MPQAPNPTPVPQDTPRTASDEPTIAHDDPDPTAQTSKRDATGPLAAIGGYLLIDRRINGAQEDRLWPHLYTDRAEAYADAKAYPGSREEALASGWTNTEGWTSRTEVIPVTKAFAENYAAIPLERFDSFEASIPTPARPRTFREFCFPRFLPNSARKGVVFRCPPPALATLTRRTRPDAAPGGVVAGRALRRTRPMPLTA